MANFDLHNLLFPSEFEKFCRDLLEIREGSIKFTTFTNGRDGGIDIKSTNSKLKIIAQCKLYNPQNYKGFINSLKNEVAKCKRQKPDRYIICTNIELSLSRAEEVKELFGDFILNQEDIIDGIKFNKYLEEQKYEHLFKIYSKLLVPNWASIELALENIINKKYLNKTKTFVDEISEKHRLFHNTDQLPYLIQKLEDNKVIVLSGNPGVGKTTTAMMIANYFISRKKCEVLYLEERDYTETLALAKENRLIIVDDFWGQNFTPSIQKHSTFQRELHSIIKYFIRSSSSYLILVSRDYVIKGVLAQAEYETEGFFKQNKYIINIEEFTFKDKLRIFINHLLFYDYDLSYIERIKHCDNFEYLLKHKNYSPRHLDFFVKTYLHQEQASAYSFYKAFESYLDSPLVFWKETFAKLNPASKLILLILLVSSDPMNLKELQLTFNSAQIEVRHILNESIIPSDFQKDLLKLEEFYISIDESTDHDSILIKFQSPGIKDYLLDFLRTDGWLWIKPIISNVLFFNQLTFIFSTSDEKISDYESDIPLYGKKIILDDELKMILKRKLLSEFDNLSFSNYEERVFSDQLSRSDPVDDTKYLKLLELDRLFDIKLPENADVKTFIIEQVLADIDKCEESGKVVSHRSMIYFPGIMQLIYSDLNFSADRIIQLYYNSITFANEYEHFYAFNNIFPLEFQNFYNSHIKRIKKHINELIYDDTDYYLWEDSGEIGVELDSLLNFTIEELAKKYKIRITKKFVKDLESTFDMKFSFLVKGIKKFKKKKAKSIKSKRDNKYKPKHYQSIIEEYLPSEDTYDPIEFLKEYKYLQYVEEVKNVNSPLSKFKINKFLFEDIIHFFIRDDIEVRNAEIYQLIYAYFENYSRRIKIESRLLVDLFYHISDELRQSDNYSITRTRLNLLIKKTGLNTLNIEDLSPIIVSCKSWYMFSADVFRIYFSARHFYFTADNDKFKEELIGALWDPYDNQILEFLQSIDKKRLWRFCLIPEVLRLMEAIDFTDEKSIVFSFIHFFEIEFDLSWDQKAKTFETFAGSCKEAHFENILSFCQIEFYISDFETFFEKEYQNKDTINRLSINTNSVEKLSQVVRKTIQPQKGHHFVTDEPVILFDIKLCDFLKSDKNYEILQEVGMTKFVFQIIEKIKLVSEANHY